MYVCFFVYVCILWSFSYTSFYLFALTSNPKPLINTIIINIIFISKTYLLMCVVCVCVVKTFKIIMILCVLHHRETCIKVNDVYAKRKTKRVPQDKIYYKTLLYIFHLLVTIYAVFTDSIKYANEKRHIVQQSTWKYGFGTYVCFEYWQ